MTTLRALAYVHWGRWIARCPLPGCPGAEHFGADPDTRHVGGLTGHGFRCAHCEWTGPAQWPENVDDIMYLLNQRPVPATRNWLVGEPLENLLAENLEHGVIPPHDGAPGTILAIGNDRIVTGALAGVSRKAIGADR